MPEEEPFHGGLIIARPPETTFIMGSGDARARFGAAAALDLNPSGDWRQWLPQNEWQREYGFETNACGVFALYKGWIILGKFHGFTDFPADLSERYGGVMCGVTLNGSEPINNAEVTRKRVGVIPQELMPWNDPNMDTWPLYYDVAQANNNLSMGREYMNEFDLGYELVWKYEDKDMLTGKQKTDLLRAAMKRGPVSVSVSGYYRTRQSAYYKNDGDPDSHFITMVAMEKDGSRIMHDQYDPFIKRFEKDYNHDIAIVFFLQRKPSVPKTFFSSIIEAFAKVWLKK